MDWGSLVSSGVSAYGSYTQAQSAADQLKASQNALAASNQNASAVASSWKQYLPWIIGGAAILVVGFIGLIFVTRD